MSDPAPMSPCINLCTLDLSGVCIGCFRSLEEITRWTSMSAIERWRVIEAAERRRRTRPASLNAVNDCDCSVVEATTLGPVDESWRNKVSADVVDRIKQQLTAKPVVLFMKGTPDFPQCGFSAQTVAALRACDAEFTHVNIFEDPELREALKAYSSWPTYPQLYVNGELVGGSDIALEMYRSGELKKLLESAGAVKAA